MEKNQVNNYYFDSFNNRENKITINLIHNVNCISLINKMIKENIKVDLILTDPPYNISRKNNFQTINRNGIDFGKWDTNFNQTAWLKNINKIVSDNGSIIIFNDWKNLGLISKKLSDQGFDIKDILRWVKPAPMPRNTSRRYVSDCEFAIWATKRKAKWTFNKIKEPYLKPEFNFSHPGIGRIHPTQKPIKLIEEILKIHSNEGDIIFDPFSGSGTISLAANNLNRFYYASEINKNYCELSNKRIKNSFLKPAFNHLGNKYRMLDELFRFFPKKNIDYFIDVFAGSGIVSLSYKSAKKIILNDNDKWLSKILELLINTNSKIVIENIEKIISKYKLPTFKKTYGKEYNILRANFNKNKDCWELLVLILFGFNQQIRFNSKDEFNIPTGKFYWNEYHKNKIINFINNSKEKRICIRNQEFTIFVLDILNEINKESTIFYFDPPYFLSNATYNSSWNENEEKKLLSTLQKLTDEGYKWYLSNIIESKGRINVLLTEFIELNKEKIEVYFIDNINYTNSNYQRQKRTKVDREIIIKGFR